LRETLSQTFKVLEHVIENHWLEPEVQEVGTVTYVGPGVIRVTGLSNVKSEELLRFTGGRMGMAFNLDQTEIGVILLAEIEGLAAGSDVQRTGRLMDTPVGEELLGRVVDAQGHPLDNGGQLRTSKRRPIERPAPAIMDRAPVTVPLQTGLKVIDALIPIGRGQRELILGDRQTGKTAIALDTIINQRDKDVICVYCGIGKRGSAAAKVIGLLCGDGDYGRGPPWVAIHSALCRHDHGGVFYGAGTRCLSRFRRPDSTCPCLQGIVASPQKASGQGGISRRYLLPPFTTPGAFHTSP